MQRRADLNGVVELEEVASDDKVVSIIVWSECGCHRPRKWGQDKEARLESSRVPISGCPRKQVPSMFRWQCGVPDPERA